MKKIKYSFLIMLFSMIIYGCKKDHSNTEVRKLQGLSVDTIGGFGSYVTKQGVGEVVVDPNVIYDGDADNLTYLWRLWQTSGNPGAATPSPDTSLNKQFKSVINKPPGNYTLELQVKEKNTGITTYMRYTIVVQTPVPYGWLVLYETLEGNATVGYVRTAQIVKNLAEEDIRTDLYTPVNGAPIPGVPIGFYNTTTIFTDKGGLQVNAPDYKKTLNYADLFTIIPPVKPEGIAGSFLIADNGTAYWWYPFFSGGFTSKVEVTDGNGYRIAPRAVNHGTASTAFFDDLNKRFVMVPASESAVTSLYGPPTVAPVPAPRFVLYNIGKTLISDVVLPAGSGAAAIRYGFFRDIDETKTWLYGIKWSTPDNPDAAVYDLTTATGAGFATNINQAKFFDMGTLGAMAVCATDTKVFGFTYGAAGIADASNGFTTPAGEVITSIKIFKNAGSGFTAAESLNNKILMVATWNAAGNIGKLYMLSLNSVNGSVSATPIRVISGFGRIKDMILKTS